MLLFKQLFTFFKRAVILEMKYYATPQKAIILNLRPIQQHLLLLENFMGRETQTTVNWTLSEVLGRTPLGGCQKQDNY
jgi:hypothetical protein